MSAGLRPPRPCATHATTPTAVAGLTLTALYARSGPLGRLLQRFVNKGWCRRIMTPAAFAKQKARGANVGPTNVSGTKAILSNISDPNGVRMEMAELPPEARQTLELIRKGGPFPYKQDGVVFGNREKRLPLQPRGYYREYTVKTPGSRDRGARRIVAGRFGEYYYSDDHYRSFKRIRD